jgi:hypothetical protein
MDKSKGVLDLRHVRRRNKGVGWGRKRWLRKTYDI